MKPLLPPEIIEELRKFDSPTLSNAIERLNVRDRTVGFASMELRCQFPELGPMVGYAVTCTANSTYPGRPLPTKLNDLIDAVAAAPKPVIVVIQNAGHDRGRSCFIGDMICSVYHKLGGVGVVTDGGVRDLADIRKRAPGFQVFAPGCVVSHGNVVALEVGLRVCVGGLAVEPGDLLHGDENVVLHVPNDRAEDVLEKARLVRKIESELFDYVERDSVSVEDLKRRLGL